MATSPSRSRTPLVIGIVVALVAVAAIVAVVASSGGDDDDTAAECVFTPPSIPSVPADSGDGVFGTVSVEGDWLVQGEGSEDPCLGERVPTLRGEDYAGDATAILPGEDGPMMVVVMAHWCPHCNREVPLLVEWGASGAVPEGLQVVGVSTAAREDGEHFPPSTWLADEMAWEWPVIADDQLQTAAAALGTTGYPYLMFVDADGNLMARASGELPIEDVQALADEAAATATA